MRLSSEIGKALALRTVSDRLTSEEFAQLIRSEGAKWAKVIKAAGVKPE